MEKNLQSPSIDTYLEEIDEKLAKIAAEEQKMIDQDKYQTFSLGESTEPESLLDVTTSHFIATKLGVDLDTEKALENRIQEFKKNQTKQIQNYLEESKRKKSSKDHFLYILNGWNTQETQNTLISQSRQTCGGFFIRWNGMGIVLNPGANFLENFHNQGLYINDIHYVIVTQDSKEADADIKKIYDLNYQLNKVSPELHIIHYYLNHQAYQKLSHKLKPNFKQERSTVHSLELFLDSPDVENEELAEGIQLSYFSTSSRGGYSANNEYQEPSKNRQPACVGIRLDLSSTNSYRTGAETIRLGYISGSAWSPLIAHHLGICDLLIAGFGTTHSSDYGKLNYNENSLGYFGTYTLFEELKPKLLLCTEFDGSEGDIRLEVTRKMRKEYQKSHSESKGQPAIFPADNGLFIDLKTQNIECSITKKLLDPKEVIVMKSADAYGKLQYLSPSCIL